MAAEDEEFEWRGQAGLGVRACQFRHPLGYRPQHVLQLEPPSAVTSLALDSDWGLLAAGQVMLCCQGYLPVGEIQIGDLESDRSSRGKFTVMLTLDRR